MSRRNPLAAPTNAVTLASNEAAIAPPLIYDYHQIAEEHRSPVMLAARRIKFKAERTKQDLLDIGKELTEVKARLSHGQFGEWLAVEFDMSERSAQRFMSVYETYGSKSDTVSLLSDSALYLLSGPSVPAEARDQVEDEARTTGRSPTKTRVQEIIASHRPPASSPEPTTPADPAGVIDVAGDAIEDTAQDGDGLEPQNLAAPLAPQAADLVDLVTMEAHIWRVALLEVGHDLTRLHQWIAEHDRPDPYGRIACAQPHTFHEAYSAVRQEIAAKYDYGTHPLPLPPAEEEPPTEPVSAKEHHNWRINQLTAALGRIQQMDFEHYSNITGDWTSPRKLTDIAQTMIHKLEGNIR